MEHIIAKLLQDFENGKLTRRQLIESLALAVTAGSAAGAAPVPATSATGFKAVAVNHISYQVADYARTRDFYQDLFGMKLLKDDGKLALLSFGNTFMIPRTKDVGTPTIDHIAYTIDPWDRKAVEEELKRRGLDPKPDTDYSFLIKDPNGFLVQISSREMDGIKA